MPATACARNSRYKRGEKRANRGGHQRRTSLCGAKRQWKKHREARNWIKIAVSRIVPSPESFTSPSFGVGWEFD